MGSEETARVARQRVPTLYLAPILVLTGAVLIWLVFSAQHTGSHDATTLLEVSQLEVEIYCNRELANVLAIQQEVRSLAEHFDNLGELLGPAPSNSTPTPPRRHHRRHLVQEPATAAEEEQPTQFGTCPTKLATALSTISTWMGGLHSEVLALIKSSAGALETTGSRPPQADHVLKQQLEAALAQKGALEKALAAANEDRDKAKELAQQLKQKLDTSASKQPSDRCWIADKNDGVLVNRTVLRGSPVYVDNVRQSMVLPLNDEWVSNWIATTESPFDTPILQQMLNYIRAGDVVLDIGANLGTYSIWFAQKVGAAGSVWSFEPQPYVYQVLCTNVVINGHRNIRTVNGALSFKAGMASMDSKVPDGTSEGKNFADVTTNHTTKVNYGGRRLGVGGEKVPMLTLDSLKLPKVSFMKIDVQGAEPLVIWGARETIQRTLPVINYEASWGYKVTPEMKESLQIPDEVATFDIAAWLKSIGYQYMELISEDQFWVPPKWTPPPGWAKSSQGRSP